MSNIPVIIFIVVVFPAPFGPKNPKISPSLISRLILSITFFPFLYDFETFFISIIIYLKSPHYNNFI